FAPLSCCLECLITRLIHKNIPSIKSCMAGIKSMIPIVLLSYLTLPEKSVCIGISFGIWSYMKCVKIIVPNIIIPGTRNDQYEWVSFSLRKVVSMTSHCFYSFVYFLLIFFFFI